MIKFLILICFIWTTCDSLSQNVLNYLTPNEFFLNRTYHSLHVKRDKSMFNNDFCREQLDRFKLGLDQEEHWALESEIK